MPRRLVVNADDLGCSRETSAGIVHAARHGIVTSASLMVRHGDAADAVSRAAEAGLTDLGLHLDMGEWAFRDGAWVSLYDVVDRDDAAAVAAECDHQLDLFHRLVGRAPTHLDSHQHTHLAEPLRGIAVARAAALGIPLRHLDRRVTYFGGFYGQSGRGEPAPELLSVASLLELLDEWLASPAAEGAVALEIGCHPGWDADLDTMYRDERRREVEVLCDPALPPALAARGFVLSSFREMVAETPEAPTA